MMYYKDLHELEPERHQGLGIHGYWLLFSLLMTLLLLSVCTRMYTLPNKFLCLLTFTTVLFFLSLTDLMISFHLKL